MYTHVYMSVYTTYTCMYSMLSSFFCTEMWHIIVRLGGAGAGGGGGGGGA